MKTLREMIDLVEGRGADVQGTFSDLQEVGFILARELPRERIYVSDLDTVDPDPHAVSHIFKTNGWNQMNQTFTGHPLPRNMLLFANDSPGGGSVRCEIKDGIVDRIHFNFHQSND